LTTTRRRETNRKVLEGGDHEQEKGKEMVTNTRLKWCDTQAKRIRTGKNTDGTLIKDEKRSAGGQRDWNHESNDKNDEQTQHSNLQKKAQTEDPNGA